MRQGRRGRKKRKKRGRGEKRKKPPGVLAAEEEALRDSSKAFLPTDLLPVPDCHHTGAPTAITQELLLLGS